jgi:hypothetical protein
MQNSIGPTRTKLKKAMYHSYTQPVLKVVITCILHEYSRRSNTSLFQHMLAMLNICIPQESSKECDMSLFPSTYLNNDGYVCITRTQ